MLSITLYDCLSNSIIVWASFPHLITFLSYAAAPFKVARYRGPKSHNGLSHAFSWLGFL